VILGLSGSLRADSTNTAVLRLCPGVTIYDGLAELPHFSPDLDVDPAPPAVARLRGALRDADGVVICTPEYAFSMPGVLKTALEWTVSSAEFDRKPTVVISASPLWGGGDKALAHLLMVLQAINADVVHSMAIPLVKKRLDAGDLGPELAAAVAKLPKR
jgi:chromate reductase, NAD(P)H dehydrogenase (quinone)